KILKHFTKKSLQSPDDVHVLRVKSRELSSLLSKEDAFAKIVKKAISLSNEIRDIDVFFSDYLASLPKRYRKKLQEEIAEKVKEDAREKEIKKLRKYLKNLQIPKSLEQKTKEETPQTPLQIKFPPLEKKKLHKYRITIKKRLYIEKNSSVKDEKKIKILTEMKDALGAINDNYNGLERVHSYGVKEKLYKKIERYTQEENARVYEKIKDSYGVIISLDEYNATHNQKELTKL
ncbi:MAG: CHAD domain-containing protein, partial [Sulfurimonas sp.]|uniref:CHAD domain-containing protein n=1 Tax=Sulfurimonas sp. TaxID=2022749 RepID=UPI0026187A1F